MQLIDTEYVTDNHLLLGFSITKLVKKQFRYKENIKEAGESKKIRTLLTAKSDIRVPSDLDL